MSAIKLLMVLSFWIFSALLPVQAETRVLSVNAPLPFLHQLPADSLLSGAFEQQRSLAGIDRPLYASGRWLFAPGYGLSWQQHKPFVSQLSFQDQQMRQKVGDQPAQVIDYQQQPLAFYFSEVFTALFSGDSAPLFERFTISAEVIAPQTTRLHLSPLDPLIKKGISTIVLSGGEQLEQIEVIDQMGGHLILKLSDWEEHTRALSPAERALFE